MKNSPLFYLPTTSLAIDRAWQAPFRRSEADLFKEWFSIDSPLPEGALAAYAHDLIQRDANSVWCRMALRPYIADHRQVHLSTESVSLSVAQYENVFQHLKEWLQQDNLWLYATQTGEWLCRLDQHAKVEMLQESLMPQGQDGNFWQRLMTECQMLLSQIGVADTLLHCWGVGVLPQKLEATWSRIVSDNVVMQGLAKCADIPFQKWTNNFEEISEGYFVTQDAEYHLKPRHYYYFWRGKNGIRTRTSHDASAHLSTTQS